jgi:hypothetical protein
LCVQKFHQGGSSAVCPHLLSLDMTMALQLWTCSLGVYFWTELRTGNSGFCDFFGLTEVMQFLFSITADMP